ncbi:MAG: transporter [Gammaproteobacteria bacterium]|nr:transporter [Gammaproteobacteria bacterium]
MKTLYLVTRPALLLTMLLPLANFALADHPSFGFGSASGGINTTSALPLANNQWVFLSRGEFIDNDAFSDAELEDFASQGIEEVHSTDSVFSVAVGLAYGITDKTLLSLYLPYVKRTNIREGEEHMPGEGEVEVLGDSAGIGDAVAQLQYQAWQKNDLYASLIAGIKLPTGETSEKTNDGDPFELEFQPGSGSWDPILGFAISKLSGRLAIDASMSYIFATEGKQNTNLGDILDYDISVGYRLTDSHVHNTNAAHTDSHWDILLELNGESRERATEDSIDKANQGGTTIYLSPGIAFSTSSGFTGYLSLGLPVVNRLHGLQSEPDYRIIAGLNWSL